MTFDKRKCNIIHNKRIILTGPRDFRNGLWTVSLNGNPNQQQTSEGEAIRDCYNLHRINKINYTMQNSYAAIFSPPKDTLLRAVKLNLFIK